MGTIIKSNVESKGKKMVSTLKTKTGYEIHDEAYKGPAPTFRIPE